MLKYTNKVIGLVEGNMPIKDVLKSAEYKNELRKLKKFLTPEMLELKELHDKRIELMDKLQNQKKEYALKLRALSNNMESLSKQEDDIRDEIKDLNKVIVAKKREIFTLDDEILMYAFGLYAPQYDYATSQQYKDKIKRVRDRQKELLKDNQVFEEVVEGEEDETQIRSRRSLDEEDEKVIECTELLKIIIKSFNIECDDCVKKVDFKNVDVILERLDNYYEQINESILELKVKVKRSYLNLKKQEIRLAHEYAKKLNREKQDEADELVRRQEEENLKQEKQRESENLNNEEEKLKKDLKKYQSILAITPQERKGLVLEQIEKTKEGLKNIEKNRQFLTYVNSNTKAGFVYVVSNIGVFGEDIYHVGMTRSLNPDEVIGRIGAGALPYQYDAHAMVFSTDAEELKNTVVASLAPYRMNLVNTTRDFFNVSLKEIIVQLRKKHKKPIECAEYPQAEEYRISEKMRYKALHPDEEEEEQEAAQAIKDTNEGENTEEKD